MKEEKFVFPDKIFMHKLVNMKYKNRNTKIEMKDFKMNLLSTPSKKTLLM